MYARVEDLRKGDIVLVASSQGLFDVKLLRTPQRAKTGKTKTWGGNDRWTSIPCEMRIDTVIYHPVNYQGVVRTYSINKKVLSNGQPYNTEKRIDFSERECWIIKRAVI